MGVIVAGINHRKASLDVREKIAFRVPEIPEALAEVRAAADAPEGVVLSTCNRTEIYLVDSERSASNDVDACAVVWHALSARLGRDAADYGYVHRDRAAVEHLYRVASGLDSMILGESQIHAQVRDAWETCREQSGTVLNRLFQSSLSVAGRVRDETAIGRGAASVSSAAVQLAKQIFGGLAGRRAMILGAGAAAELALECLVEEGVRTVLVANRTFERAQSLAAKYEAAAVGYDECWAAARDVDVLLCSTASPVPVVTRQRLEASLASRGDRPLCILDISVPRDVEQDVRRLENVFLYDLDDLHEVVSGNIERRRSELPAAEAIIAEEAGRYWEWFASLSAVPAVRRFRSHMEEVRQQELSRAMHLLQGLSAADRAVVEQFSRSLMNKFLHEPTVRLRSAAANGRGPGVVDTALFLFGLEEANNTANSVVNSGANSGANGAANGAASETPNSTASESHDRSAGVTQ